MEKFLSPLRNTENDCGKALVEKNIPADQDQEVEITHEKLTEKSRIENKNIKVKKLKVKKCRGEKRKLPDKSDTKKIKRKKKEEKLQSGQPNPNETCGEINDSEVVYIKTLSPSLPGVQKKEEPTAAENDSDLENSERPVKQRISRKSKAVASKCRQTLDVLSSLDSDVLISMDKSLKILRSNNLLDNKLISVDVLLDLITLALETNNKGPEADCEKELSLLSIISKCVTELSTTPKRVKARQSLAGVCDSPKSNLQEEVPPPSPASKEEILEKQTPKIVDLEEPMEETDSQAEQTEEPAVEKSGKNFCITNYFKKVKRTVEEKDKNERFSGFTTKTDMFLAPKLGRELTEERRKDFEDEFSRQDCESNYLSKVKRKKKSVSGTRDNKSNSDADKDKEVSQEAVEVKDCPSEGGSDTTSRKRVSLIRVDKPKTEATEAVCRTKAKLFQFHDNRRPPYWGTWRKKSESVGPRRPFGREKTFNYEIDSDDEWEEEEEPGESLHGSDDEKEPEEDYEVDNDFFVPHGYLSDDENPEKENLSPKKKLDLLEEQFTSEQKQKTRKMTPIVFGVFWEHNEPPEGTLLQDLQIDKLQYVPWTSIPVEIEEEDEKKGENLPEQSEPSSQVKKSKQKFFPNEEIPNLIKMIHGSPQNSDNLARKFLLYWETEKIPIGNRPGLTKVCVQKKIKELAAWQASHEKGKMCWQVPKETREEFGAEVESKSPEKKPRKCFFWKFVRRGEKDRGAGNPPAPAAPSVEPEVLILES